jgi:4-hydroxy-4-methyl-2-oxoglutarate aldolase
VWGDILTWLANHRGVAGTVIDGACRDTRLARELGYPVYSRSYSMRTGKDRVQVESVNGPVNIGDARVEPGDILRGDADGVLVIPRVHEEAVLTAAEEIDAVEQRIRAALKDGKTLVEARTALGYHQLQTRRT